MGRDESRSGETLARMPRVPTSAPFRTSHDAYYDLLNSGCVTASDTSGISQFRNGRRVPRWFRMTCIRRRASLDCLCP